MLFLRREPKRLGEKKTSGTPLTEHIQCAVLDFDGTLTDVEKESGPFTEKYRKGFAKMIRISENGLAPLWDLAEKKILSDPTGNGWKIDGKIVAPAHPDPYIFATVSATEVLDMLDLYPDPAERLRKMDALFHSSYEGLETVFREGAGGFIARLMEELDVSIATSSATDSVLAKLGALKLRTLPPVFGNASKYVLDPSWTEMQESFRPEGYGRPVYLRRKRYWDILEGIKGNRPNREMIVVGDIYELDLALPQFAGMNICLASRASTPASHIAAADSGIIIGELGSGAEEILKYKRAA